MPNLTTTIPHQLGRIEAKARIQHQLGALREQPGLSFADFSGTWVGDQMNFTIHTAGQSVTGRMDVQDRWVHVEVALPWLLSLMAGAVKQRIEHGVHNALERSARIDTGVS